ncbi:MAG: hypothetical protein HY720_13125 [Planctomycetes bacterium]|nr:hypothetical protein [Planctomycetota bacterium]
MTGSGIFRACAVASLALSIVGCDAHTYKKLKEENKDLEERHAALDSEHRELRRQTRTLLEQTAKERRLVGLHYWEEEKEISVGEGYVQSVEFSRDGKDLSAVVRYDLDRGEGEKPDFQIFLHDTTGRVFGSCEERSWIKKISTSHTQAELKAKLNEPVDPTFFSVTLR